MAAEKSDSGTPQKDTGTIQLSTLRTTLLGLLGVAVLAVAIVIVYLPKLTAPPASGLAGEPGLTYVADLDFWKRTPRETTVAANAHFDLAHNLDNVPLTVGDWQGKDVPETNQEVMILLDPEQYIQRLYQNSQGHYLWLSMVGGRSSQPFHAPDICYDADGWQYNLGSHPVELDGGGTLYGLYLEAQKQEPDRTEPTEHVVFYFFLFPKAERGLSDGIVLFKLTSSKIGSVEETLAMQETFVRQLFSRAQSTSVQ